jgi:hypothetical protein
MGKFAEIDKILDGFGHFRSSSSELLGASDTYSQTSLDASAVSGKPQVESIFTADLY